MNVQTAFGAIGPVFLLICLGHFIHRIALVNENFWPSAEKITLYFLFPAFLIHSIGLAEEINQAVKTTIYILSFITLVIVFIVYVIAYLFNISLFKITSIIQGSIRFNSFIFLSVTASILQAQEYAIAAIVTAYMVAISNLIVMLCFEKNLFEFKGLIKALTKTISNPIILASLAGIFLNAFGIKMGPIAGSFLHLLGMAALPLSLICLGGALALPNRGDSVYKLGLLTVFIRLILFPAIGLLVLWLIEEPPLSTNLIMLYCVLPCASNSYIISKQYGGDYQLMAFVVATSTILSFIPLFFMIQFIKF